MESPRQTERKRVIVRREALAKPARRRAYYDEELLVDLLVRGDLSRREIARRVGVSYSMVCYIARGEKRKDLHERIESAFEAMLTEARRLGLRWVRALLARHIRDGLQGEGDSARKNREFVLNKFLVAPEAETPPRPPQVHLTAEDYEIISRIKGGPVGEETEDTPAVEPGAGGE